MAAPNRVTGSLRDTLRKINDQDKIITPRYTQYLLTKGDTWKPEVQERISAELFKPDRVRVGTFSASSAGRCQRQQVLSYLGAPGLFSINPQLRSIFDNGNFVHARLQGNFLDAEIIDDIEVSYPWPALHAHATPDGEGVVPDNHPRPDWRGKTFGLEIKGYNQFVYDKGVKEDLPYKNKEQYGRQLMHTGFDLWVVFWECKNTQRFHEWVIELGEHTIKSSIKELKTLNAALKKKQLPPRLPGAEKNLNAVCQECPFGGSARTCLENDVWLPDPLIHPSVRGA